MRDRHIEPDMCQIQVDREIGVDIVAITCKKLVDQIVLVAGDADVIPAAERVRYEGIDFILGPMWQGIVPDPHEHLDGQSMCPRPF